MILEDLFSHEQKLTFLAGAGISHEPPSHLPLANSILSNLFQELIIPEPEQHILEDGLSNGALRFEQVMEAVRLNFDPDLHILDILGECRSWNSMHQLLACAAGSGHHIFSTNFDSLIERAAQACGIRLRVACRGSDFSNLTTAEATLWKLHGSLIDQDGAEARDSIIATLG